jgi:hypothetical protein
MRAEPFSSTLHHNVILCIHGKDSGLVVLSVTLEWQILAHLAT